MFNNVLPEKVQLGECILHHHKPKCRTLVYLSSNIETTLQSSVNQTVRKYYESYLVLFFDDLNLS